jgi:Family of unknown function (DUF6400)
MPTNSNNLAVAFDLTLDEVRRRSAVLEAIGADWDPIRALAEEEQAYDMLYSNLDEDQQRQYDALVSAGVLPDRAVDRASD